MLKKKTYIVFIFCLIAMLIPDSYKLICKDNNIKRRLFTFVQFLFFKLGNWIAVRPNDLYNVDN